MFFNHQKDSKGSNSLFLFKREWSLLIKRLSIKVTLKLLLSLTNTENLSKPYETMFLYGTIVIPFTSLYSMRRNSKMFTVRYFKTAVTFVIGSIEAPTPKFINNART